MIKAQSSDGTFLIGLSRANCELLLEGKPIVLQVPQTGVPFRGRIVIMGGESEQSILQELLTHQLVADDVKINPLPPDEQQH